jgi:alpha-mannosidase
VTTDVEWQERHVVVKAAFPTTVEAETASFEIPFGVAERPTGRRAPANVPPAEVPVLRWADLGDGRRGLLVVGDGKGGADVRGGVLRLTLLRGPAWPDAHVDEGHQRFVYALAPHGGDWRQAGAVRRGYELNQPLLAFAEAPHAGALSGKHAFLQLSPDNVVLAALKHAEDDDDIVVRIYETAGETAGTRLHLMAPVASAEEVDLLERRRRPLPVRDGVVTVELGPYEVTSIRLRMLPPLGAYP